MQVPPEIAFRNVKSTDELKEKIQHGIDRLEEVYEGLVSCRVMVENNTPDRQTGRIYRVRIELGVPNHSLVIDRDPPGAGGTEELRHAIKEAFETARRRLLELKHKQRGQVKTHGLPPHGRVMRLLTDDKGVRYGFLMARDGRQVYFHENALVGLDYDDLEIGHEVRFAEEAGKEGPQASTVGPIDPAKVGPRQEGSVPLRS